MSNPGFKLTWKFCSYTKIEKSICRAMFHGVCETFVNPITVPENFPTLADEKNSFFEMEEFESQICPEQNLVDLQVNI